MNTTTNKLRIYVATVVLVFAACGLQAGGHPRDIDRALLITDIVLRTLLPTQTVIVQPQTVIVEPQPAVTYTTPVYQTTTVVTTPTTVITPVYTTPIYVAPTFRYTRPARYDHCRPSPRWYTPPRHHRQTQRMPNRAPNGRNDHRRR